MCEITVTYLSTCLDGIYCSSVRMNHSCTQSILPPFLFLDPSPPLSSPLLLPSLSFSSLPLLLLPPSPPQSLPFLLLPSLSSSSPLKESQHTLGELSANLHTVEKKMQLVANYFCEDAKKFKLEDLLKEILLFIQQFQSAAEVRQE